MKVESGTILNRPPLNELLLKLKLASEEAERKNLTLENELVHNELALLLEADEGLYRDYMAEVQNTAGQKLRNQLNRLVRSLINRDRVDAAELIVPGISGLPLERTRRAFAKTEFNIRTIIEHIFKETMHFDTFTQKVYLSKPPPWAPDAKPVLLGWFEFTEEDETIFSSKILTHQSIMSGMIGKGVLWPIIVSVARQRKFDILQDKINRVGKWDGVSRRHTWIEDYLFPEVETEEERNLLRIYSSKFLIGMMARAFAPGCSMRTVLIFEGPQNIGKSRFVKALGDPFAVEHNGRGLNLTDSDTFSFLLGAWVVEMAEMNTMSRSDNNAVKDFFSRTDDRFRPKYAREQKDHPRRCVFVGSINPTEAGYLSDTTGNTRFWPVKLSERKVDIEGFLAVRDQIFAEAREAYLAGETWWLDDAESDSHAVSIKDREIENPLIDLVQEYINMNRTDIEVKGLKSTFFTLTFSEQNPGLKPSNQLLGDALRQCGLISRKIYVHGKQSRFWLFAETLDVVTKNLNATDNVVHMPKVKGTPT